MFPLLMVWLVGGQPHQHQHRTFTDYRLIQPSPKLEPIRPIQRSRPLPRDSYDYWDIDRSDDPDGDRGYEWDDE